MHSETKASRRPIRKKGFHRALKRKELWAVTKHAFESTLNTLVKQMYKDAIRPTKFVGLLEGLKND